MRALQHIKIFVCESELHFFSLERRLLATNNLSICIKYAKPTNIQEENMNCEYLHQIACRYNAIVGSVLLNNMVC